MFRPFPEAAVVKALAGKKHVSIDLFTRNLGPRKARLVSVLHNVLGIAVCSTLFWYCARVVYGQYQRGVIDVQAIDMPKYLVLSIIPIGFLLLALQFLRGLVTNLITPANQENRAAASLSEKTSRPPVKEK